MHLRYLQSTTVGCNDEPSTWELWRGRDRSMSYLERLRLQILGKVRITWCRESKAQKMRCISICPQQCPLNLAQTGT